MTSLLRAGRLDDWLNPVMVKELRQGVRGRILPAAYLLVMCLQLAVIWVPSMFGADMTGELAARPMGPAIFSVEQTILLGITLLIIPSYAGIRLASERWDANVDLMFITTLKARSIIAGKFMAGVVMAVMIFSASLPFLTMTYFLRGIDVSTIALVIGIDFLLVIGAVQYAILVGSLPVPRLLGIFIGLVAFGILFGVFFASRGVLMFSLSGLGPYRSRPSSWKFLAGLAAFAVSMILGIGLMNAWSVALVSPAASNRCLPVRIVTLVVCALGPALAGLFAQLGGPGDRRIWDIWFWIVSLLAAAGIVVSVHEREEWSPRILRKVPRSALGRRAAFLFFTGSAGGVLFYTFLMAAGAAVYSYACLVAYSAPVLAYPAAMRLAESPSVLEDCLLTFGYCGCYALTALWVRTMIGPKVKPSVTWAFMAAFLGVMTILPMLMAFGAGYRTYEYNFGVISLLGLVNPIIGVEFPLKDTRDLFLLCWFLLATVVNARWFVRQWRAFKRVAKVQPVS